MTKTKQLEQIPFVEAKSVGGKQNPKVVMIRTSETTSEKGSALGIANYWHRSKGVSNPGHFVVDEAVAYRCLPENRSAGTAPRNVLVVTICAELMDGPKSWTAPSSRAALERASDIVARLLYFYRIPPRYLGDSAFDGWKKHGWRSRGGIFVDVRGDWPYEEFEIKVRDRIAALKI